MDAPSRTILLVEDVAFIASVERSWLEADGFRVLHAPCGQEAVRIATEPAERIDLVLMDINLGDGMDGVEAAQRILAARDVPLLFLSSHSEGEELARTAGIASYGYVEKTSGEAALKVSIKMAFRLFETNQALSRELADRKRAELQLEASRRSYADLVAALPFGIYRIRPDWSFSYVSDRFCELTGLRREEILANSQSAFAPMLPEDRKEVVRKTAEAFAGRTSFHWEGRGEVNGKLRWFHLESSPSPEPDGGEAWTGALYDVTDRKEMEERLLASEEKYRVLVEHALEGIFAVDESHRLIYANDECCRIVGRPLEALLGTDVRALVAPEDRERLADQHLRRKRGERLPPRFELDLLGEDGRPRRVELSVAVFRDGAGRPRTMGHVVDVSERKRAEEEREHLQLQLHQARRLESIGRLAGGVAHDFNNMLQVILGHTDLLLASVEPGGPIHEDLGEVRKAAQRSANLTQQLLAFARKQAIAPRVLDLNSTVEQMLKMLRRLIGEHVVLDWRPCSELWPVKIDPAQLDQLLANLCVNARDAIGDRRGTVVIETSNATYDAAQRVAGSQVRPGEFVALTVSDDGCGMDEATLEKIFEPFFTTKRFGEGTGLGLATIYGIVEQNRGFITVDSRPGAGSRFRIHLPRHAASRSRQESAADSPAPGRGDETILLVEDEKAVLKMTRVMLESLGYRVLAAGSPSEALALAAEHGSRIDLLMTDQVMPEMSGWVLAERLLSLFPGVRLLLMSGYAASPDAQHDLPGKRLHLLRKPFTLHTLAALVRETLNDAGPTG